VSFTVVLQNYGQSDADGCLGIVPNWRRPSYRYIFLPQVRGGLPSHAKPASTPMLWEFRLLGVQDGDSLLGRAV
jgi:hypothetical protein